MELQQVPVTDLYSALLWISGALFLILFTLIIISLSSSYHEESITAEELRIKSQRDDKKIVIRN